MQIFKSVANVDISPSDLMKNKPEAKVTPSPLSHKS